MKYVQYMRFLEDPALNHQRKENMKLKLSVLKNLTGRHDTNSGIFQHILKIVLMHHVFFYDKILYTNYRKVISNVNQLIFFRYWVRN